MHIVCDYCVILRSLTTRLSLHVIEVNKLFVYLYICIYIYIYNLYIYMCVSEAVEQIFVWGGEVSETIT